MKFRIRIPTYEEYSALCLATNEDNAVMHWSSLSWVEGGSQNASNSDYRTMRGGYNALDAINSHVSCCNSATFFRPAFDCLTPEELPEDLDLGDIIVVGSLYMNGFLVRVNQQFGIEHVPHYWRDTPLKLGNAIDAPDCTIWGVYVGDNVFVADRPLIRGISYAEIQNALLP